MKKIHFIINTLSSNSDKTLIEISSFYKKQPYNPLIKSSEYKGHTKHLTLASIKEGAKVIVACGGDGTINEIAQCLVNTNVSLGILPIGSGNGLARNLEIPHKSITEALKIISNNNCKKIDVGAVNNIYFFSNTSVAFSAQVIQCYEKIPRRGIFGYTKAFVRSFLLFKYQTIEILKNGVKKTSKPFILLVSNTNQFGYNKTLTPKASLFDGKLDLVHVEKSNLAGLISCFIYGYFKKISPFVKADSEQIEEISITSITEDFKIQLDGECINLNTNKLDIKIHPKALRVIC